MARPLSRYSSVAILLHWLIALLLLVNILLGVEMDHVVTGFARFTTFQMHKSVGITILLLSLLRLAWRLMNPPPPDAPGLARWEKGLARFTHWVFYLIMIGMPLTGWLAVSASPLNLPTVLYRIGGFPGIPWPHLPVVPHLPMEQKKAIQAAANSVHVKLAWTAYVLIFLHVAGALKHQVLGPSPVLPRMLPFLKRRAVVG
jgi:cytochrome b561